MLINIPNILNSDELAVCREQLNKVDWSDGRGSAGYLSEVVKNNNQLPDDHPLAKKLGEMILLKLDKNPLFMSAALPMKMVPPLFNKYEHKQAYGRHIDGAIRPIAGTHHRVRTDLSVTIFLSDPQSYDGGELVIEDNIGSRSVKFAAGDMVLYPGSSVHRVEPVSKGVRLAAFFWIQSMVRDDKQRSILFELDSAIQKIALDSPDQAALTDLAGVYHNLLRNWADT
jgi:PKHD-type hydroxylase